MHRLHRSRRQGKTITQQTLLGQQGINLVERRVLEMECLWYPTGSVEAGIDGDIEIRDGQTGEVLNAIVRVQSKATAEPLGSNGHTFDYVCNERDLDYWMMGNAPVILVRSRPSTEEAYWVSIKDYFRDPKRRITRRITFDKRTDVFNASARDKVAALAMPADKGIYFTPPPRREHLYSNLLPVAHVPECLFVGDALVPSPKEVWAVLKTATDRPPGEWFLHNKRIFSFHDLREAPWRGIIDLGTAEGFPTTEWAGSRDPDREYEYARLLNRCLREKAWRLHLHFSQRQECYYFPATRKLTPRRISYRSAKKGSRKTVFQAYPSKKDPTVVAYYRHTAFEGQFRRYGDQWYLEVVPTYFFTHDGNEIHPWYESKLKGIKAQERNNAVRSHVLMWADLLGEHDSGFLPHEASMLRLGSPMSFQLDTGIDEQAWLVKEDKSSSVPGGDLLEFDL